uniref:Antitoxin Xre/MbcA/ParS-like middle domain-containing protein n=1 Tax=Bosea sp. NBC_00436 TaxID=2969620 RepID=A0A9E7ZZF2_9HYPH
MVATARKSGGAAHDGMKPTAVADVLRVLARHNPGLSQAALAVTGKVVAAVTAAAARLPIDQQHQIAADDEQFAKAAAAMVAKMAARQADRLAAVPIEKPVEVSRGAGLGELLDIEEGRRRLADVAIPARLEDWAGPVAGPGEIEKLFGTKRSTLHDWHKRGAVVGLLKGERKHVFPLAQFVDGRPVEGMPQVTKIIRNPRAVWLWLIQPKPSVGGIPLEMLKHGHLDVVLAAAERDFG